MTTVAEMADLNAYHIELTYTLKQPAALTLVGKSEDEVTELLKKMLSNADSVDIVKITNYKDIPELVLLREAQEKARKEQMQADTQDTEPAPTIN